MPKRRTTTGLRSLGSKLIAAVLLTLLVAAPLAARAQEGSPAAAPEPQANGEISIAASGLANPRSFIWDADGAIWIALAGSGGTTPAQGTPIPPPAGPNLGGKTASVVKATNGQVTPVVEGLPSSISNFGQVLGAADLALLDGQAYVLIEGGGDSNGNIDQPNGVYRITDGQVELVADLSAWVKANPVAFAPEDFEPDGSPYAMVAGEDALWIVEANHGQVLTVTPDGTVTRIADLSDPHDIPTGIALAPDGGVYVGYLTQFPYSDGTAYADRIGPDGTRTKVWTGLTGVTALTVGPDGVLYAAEISTNNTQETVGQPGTGRIVRQTGPDSLEPVVTGLTGPVGADFGPDGALYVSSPAIGAENGTGVVHRIALTGGAATPVP